MKRSTIFFVLLPAFCFFLATCKKSGGNSDVINIQGFYTTDYNGNSLGWQGPQDNDWTFMTGLSSAELALFNFDTGLSLDNTVMTTIPNNVLVFPNPAGSVQAYYFPTQDSNVVKLVIVDAALHVVSKQAIKVKGSSFIHLDVSNRTQYPNRTSFRAYYSFSAKDHPDYKVGFGDIRICDGTAISGCF